MRTLKLTLPSGVQELRFGDRIDKVKSIQWGENPEYSRYDDYQGYLEEYLVYETLGFEFLFVDHWLTTIWLHIKKEETAGRFIGGFSCLETDFWQNPSAEKFKIIMGESGFVEKQNENFYSLDMLSDHFRFGYWKSPFTEHILIDDGARLRPPLEELRFDLSTETRAIMLGEPIERLKAGLDGYKLLYTGHGGGWKEYLSYPALGVEFCFEFNKLIALWIFFRQDSQGSEFKPYQGGFSCLDAAFFKLPEPDIFRTTLEKNGFSFSYEEAKPFSLEMRIRDKYRFRYEKTSYHECIFIDNGIVDDEICG